MNVVGWPEKGGTYKIDRSFYMIISTERLLWISINNWIKNKGCKQYY